jgi:hypothetical protein
MSADTTDLVDFPPEITQKVPETTPPTNCRAVAATQRDLARREREVADNPTSYSRTDFGARGGTVITRRGSRSPGRTGQGHWWERDVPQGHEGCCQ